MIKFILPMAVVIVANTLYQICAKSIPNDINPFASLTVTYLVGTIISGIMFYFHSGGSSSLLKEYANLNWAPFVLGLVIVSLEAGFIYAYKLGWKISIASIVQSAFVAVALIFIGWLGYHEDLSCNKIIGIITCLVGLALINK